MKTVVMACVCALLGACATVQVPNQWELTKQQLDAVQALKAGTSTVADVERAYGQPCVQVGHLDDSDHCFVVGSVGDPAGIFVMYMMNSAWSPSCFTDETGCTTLNQVTSLSVTYWFDAKGILRNASTDSECTAYVGGYAFKNGCLDHG